MDKEMQFLLEGLYDVLKSRCSTKEELQAQINNYYDGISRKDQEAAGRIKELLLKRLKEETELK